MPLLNFNGWLSLPSLMQAAHLFTIGVLCLRLLNFRQRLRRPCSRFLPIALAILCFYGSLDELIKLHLLIDQFNWQYIYLIALGSILIFGWFDIVGIWRYYPVTVLWTVMGLSIFLLGGFGAEAVKDAIAPELISYGVGQPTQFSEHLRITVEELAELIGETLILFAFCKFNLRVLSVPNLPQMAAKQRSPFI